MRTPHRPLQSARLGQPPPRTLATMLAHRVPTLSPNTCHHTTAQSSLSADPRPRSNNHPGRANLGAERPDSRAPPPLKTPPPNQPVTSPLRPKKIAGPAPEPTPWHTPEPLGQCSRGIEGARDGVPGQKWLHAHKNMHMGSTLVHQVDFWEGY